MGTVVRLKDGKRDIILSDRDFVDLVRKYMGDDCAEFYENRIAEIDDRFKEIVEEAEYFFDHELKTAQDTDEELVESVKSSILSLLKELQVME